GPSVGDGRADTEALAQKPLELHLHGISRGHVIGPLLIATDVAEATEHDAAVIELLPVIVSPARIHGSRYGDLLRRRRGEHLESHRTHAWPQFGQQVGESSVDGNNDSLALHTARAGGDFPSAKRRHR